MVNTKLFMSFFGDALDSEPPTEEGKFTVLMTILGGWPMPVDVAPSDDVQETARIVGNITGMSIPAACALLP